MLLLVRNKILLLNASRTYDAGQIVQVQMLEVTRRLYELSIYNQNSK